LGEKGLFDYLHIDNIYLFLFIINVFNVMLNKLAIRFLVV